MDRLSIRMISVIGREKLATFFYQVCTCGWTTFGLWFFFGEFYIQGIFRSFFTANFELRQFQAPTRDTREKYLNHNSLCSKTAKLLLYLMNQMMHFFGKLFTYFPNLKDTSKVQMAVFKLSF